LTNIIIQSLAKGGESTMNRESAEGMKKKEDGKERRKREQNGNTTRDVEKCTSQLQRRKKIFFSEIISQRQIELIL
jgi:hypothetical protein